MAGSNKKEELSLMECLLVLLIILVPPIGIFFLLLAGDAGIDNEKVGNIIFGDIRR